MTDCGLDHFVVTAPDLEVGVKFVSETLGVLLQVGGEHQVMGTHNSLLRLGESLYLEVIAPDPNAPKPERSRWFDLDHQSPHTAPKLAAWVARTIDIHAALAACTEPLGRIEPMSRGDLHWLITIPSDGRLPFNGLAPALIQWQTSRHPAASLQDMGCSLIGLEGFHPQASRIQALLESIRFHGEVTVLHLSTDEPPFLVAHIKTPDGLRHLSAAIH